MNIEVRLYANFRDFLPASNTTFASFDWCCAGEGMMKSLEKAVTIGEFLKELSLPVDIPKVVIVNDSPADFDYVLKDGDRISVFPLLGGG